MDNAGNENVPNQDQAGPACRGTGNGGNGVGAGNGEVEKLQALCGEGMISYFLQLCLI